MLGIERVLTPCYHTTGDTIGPHLYQYCGVNHLLFATKVIQTGVAAMAKLAVPIHSGVPVMEQRAVTHNDFSIVPNPGNRFVFNLNINSDDEFVAINIYNTLGQLVKSFDRKYYNRGLHKIYWNGNDRDNKRLPSGIYFVKFDSAKNKKLYKLVLLN